MGLYKRADSTFYWIQIDQHRESTGTANYQEAKAFYEKRRVELWQTRHLKAPQAHTWGDAAARWLQETGYKRDHAGDQQRLAFLAEMDILPLADMTQERLDARLWATPTLRTAGARNRYRATVRAVLRRSERHWGWLLHAPPILLEPEPAPDIQPLTPEQARRLVDCAPGHLQPVIRFALATGLRKSNILDLRWSRVDLPRRQLWISHSDAKGKKTLGLPLNAMAMAVLQEQVGKHPEFVFTCEGRHYQWIDHRTWLALIDRAGLPQGFRFHDLRHTWASWLAQAGVDPQHLRQLGGWSTLKMVERYSHLNVDHLRAAADAITF